MDEFLDWAFSGSTPVWVELLILIGCVAFCVSIVVGSLVAVVLGYWIVPVLVFLVIPTFLVTLEYQKYRKIMERK